MKFVVGLALILLPSLASACQCVNFSIEDFIDDATSVHLISVTSVSVADFPRNIEGAEVQFNVVENLLNPDAVPNSLYVLSNNCSVILWPGNQYIIFVPKVGFYTDIDNSVSSCSGIIPFNPYKPTDKEKLKEVKEKIKAFNGKQS